MTIDGETRKLDEVFFVIATQNPIESSGTFPLPEAQMDRFFMKLSMGFPSKEEELAILDRFQLAEPLKTAGAGRTERGDPRSHGRNSENLRSSRG